MGIEMYLFILYFFYLVDLNPCCLLIVQAYKIVECITIVNYINEMCKMLINILLNVALTMLQSLIDFMPTTHMASLGY